MQKSVLNKKTRGDVRREQVVRASLKVIGKSGVSGLTTAAIAREVGMSEANLYRHFRNKNDILLAAIGVIKGMIRTNFEHAVADAKTPLETLSRFVLLQIDLMQSNPGIPRFLFSEELHIHGGLRKEVLQMMYGFSTKLAALIREAQRSGTMCADLDPKMTALMLIGTMQGLMFRWSLSGFSFSLMTEGKKLWKNIQKTLVVREAPKGRQS